jgi:hypothetical protein
MKQMTLVVGIVFVLSSASIAVAQGERGQQRGRGQGPGSGIGVAGLLAMPEVQKELAVTADQKGLIDDLLSDLRGSNRGRQDNQDVSREERQKRAEEQEKKTEDLLKTILEAKQVDRLNQLRLQREGASAMARAEIADALKLTQEQKEKIGKIRDESRTQRGQRGEARQETSREDRQKAAAEFRERREKTNADILAVLTADQKATWEKMQGKKFDFPPPQPRRPGGN